MNLVHVFTVATRCQHLFVVVCLIFLFKFMILPQGKCIKNVFFILSERNTHLRYFVS